MSILTTISNYASNIRARRLRARTYLEVTSLPREVQKDIGWPDAYALDTGRDRTQIRSGH